MTETQPLEPGTWVVPADPAAYPGIVGEVLEVSYVYHSVTGEACATYDTVAWHGRGHKPDDSQESTAVMPAHGIEAATVTLW